MNDLSDRIRTQIDLVAPPIAADEVIATPERTTDVAPLRKRDGAARPVLLVARAAAAVVVAAGVATIAVQRSDSTLEPASVPPRPSDLPATGVVFSPEDALALFMAENTLIAECMAERGWDYPRPTTDELVVMFGAWSPHPVLGIQRAGAARQIGYPGVEVDLLGSPGQWDFPGMDPGQQTEFLVDLEGPAAAPSAEGEVTPGDVTVGGCRGEVQIPSLSADEAMRAAVNDAAGLGYFAPSGAGFDDVAIDDPRVEDALSMWSDCVATRTGERADTPNELARRLLEGNWDASANTTERDIATADAECQQEADLWTVWYTVVAELTRERLGPRAGLYDDWTRARVELVENARAVLAARDIELPSLD